MSAERFELIDMGDPGLMRNPYEEYGRIRERAPAVLGARPPIDPVPLITRYDDVRGLYRDPRFAVNPLSVPGQPGSHLSERTLRAGETPAEYLAYRVDRMGQRDGAAHARLRGLVEGALSAKAMAALRPRIERIADDLLDEAFGETAEEEGDGPATDLFQRYALPLAHTVLCELIGIPRRDHAQWLSWTTEIKSAALSIEEKADRWHDLTTYAARLIWQRRTAPADDLVSRLVRAGPPEGAARLTGEEITTIMLMDHDAHRSVAHLIAGGVHALLTRPEQAALLRKEPVPPGAIHELLRFLGPITLGCMRHATEDLELCGMRLRRGDSVRPVLAAANWDPRRFTAPERLDLRREPYGHLAFGDGPHRCLGEELTLVTTEVAIVRLLGRYPGVSLDLSPPGPRLDPKPRQWGLVTLPVRLTDRTDR